MQAKTPNYYDLLNVKSDSSQDEINDAFTLKKNLWLQENGESEMTRPNLQYLDDIKHVMVDNLDPETKDQMMREKKKSESEDETQAPSEETLEQFAISLQQNLVDACGADSEQPGVMATAFAELIIENLKAETEILDSTTVSHFDKPVHSQDAESRGERIEITAIGLDEERDQLDLVIAHHRNQSPPKKMSRRDIDRSVRRAGRFAQLAVTGLLKDKVDIGEVAYSQIEDIHNCRNQIERINLFLITDQILPSGYRPEMPVQVDNKSFSLQLWGLTKIRALQSGHLDEPVDINFVSDFGESIPCIESPTSDNGYTAYMAVIPGSVLYKAYDKFRTRLLEENVRHFLQSKGKVNKGILETINGDPDKFFAYNNGITTTASQIEFVGRGERRIRTIKGWQIVNGGQTTASIHTAGDRDPESLAHVAVAAKIIVVNQARSNTGLIAAISRYSNSQNKVVESDFASNLPYFRAMESLSRHEWIKSTADIQARTRWYFERTKGQYNNEMQLARPSPGGMAGFKKQNPKNQQFNKLDLAKSENSWELKPHIVSLGNEKNFEDYEKSLPFRQDPDDIAFREIVGRLILFRQTEEIIKKNLPKDFRNNIVAYTIASLSMISSQQVDMLKIFTAQGLGGAMSSLILRLARRINELIDDSAAAANMRNIGEWCKKQGCWDHIMSTIMTNHSDFEIPANALVTPVVTTLDQPDLDDSLQKWSTFLADVSNEQWRALVNLNLNIDTVERTRLVAARGRLSQRIDRRWIDRISPVLTKCLSQYRSHQIHNPELDGFFNTLETLPPLS